MVRVSQWGLLAVVCLCASLALDSRAAAADDPKKVDGIHGKVQAVDVEEGTLTITIPESTPRTFQINDETLIVGPRGGVVRQRLKDKRFHAGLEVAVVPGTDGRTAKEVHLGYDRRATTTKSAKRPTNQATEDTPTKPDKTVKGKLVGVYPRDSKIEVKVIETGFTGNKLFTINEDTKILGPKDAVSTKGIRDDRLKPGADITMIVAGDNRTVRELRLPERK